MFGPSVFGLTFSELISSVFVRAALGRLIFWLFGLRVGSGEEMISGNLPIESGRAQGCFLFLKNGILDFGKPSNRISACSRLFFFSGKMAISDSGSQFLDSGSPPRALGRAQGYFFSEKLQSGILEALREHQGVLKAFFF